MDMVMVNGSIKVQLGLNLVEAWLMGSAGTYNMQIWGWSGIVEQL